MCEDKAGAMEMMPARKFMNDRFIQCQPSKTSKPERQWSQHHREDQPGFLYRFLSGRLPSLRLSILSNQTVRILASNKALLLPTLEVKVPSWLEKIGG